MIIQYNKNKASVYVWENPHETHEPKYKYRQKKSDLLHQNCAKTEYLEKTCCVRGSQREASKQIYSKAGSQSLLQLLAQVSKETSVQLNHSRINTKNEEVKEVKRWTETGKKSKLALSANTSRTSSNLSSPNGPWSHQHQRMLQSYRISNKLEANSVIQKEAGASGGVLHEHPKINSLQIRG